MEDQAVTATSPAPAPESPRRRPLERLWQVLVAPGRAFAGLENDRLAWIFPAVLLAVILWAPAQIPGIRNLQIEQQREQFERLMDRGVLPAEHGEELLARIDRQKEIGWASRLGQLGLALVTLPAFRFLLPALLLWIGVRFIMEGRARYLAVVSVTAFSALPAGLREILRAPLRLSKGDLGVHFSPAALTGTDSVSGYVLDQLDVFDAWIIILVIIGLARVSGLSPKRSAGLVIPLWIAYTLVKIGYRASPFFVAA